MFNKKGVAAEEITGFLTFVVIAIIAGLIFYGCSVGKIKRDYEQLQFSKEEILGSKELNFFLQKPVNNTRNVYDIIIDEFLRSDSPQLNNIGMDEYFSNKYAAWDITLSYNRKVLNYNGGSKTTNVHYGTAILPVPNEPYNNEYVSIVLYFWPY